MTRRRTKARTLALQALYQLDVTQQPLPEVLDTFWRVAEGSQDDNRYANDLIIGVTEHHHEIDQQLEANSEHWKLSRMSRIDRNILRLATFELLHCPDVPPAVVMNEAIELAKRFGTADSSGYINGVLDKILNLHGSTDAPKHDALG